jgi:hypothetical protein
MKHQRFIKDDPAGRFTNKDAGLAICACAISTLSDYKRAFREIDLALGLLTAAAPNFFQFASDRRGHPPSACRRRRGSDFRQRIAVFETSAATGGRLLAFLGRLPPVWFRWPINVRTHCWIAPSNFRKIRGSHNSLKSFSLVSVGLAISRRQMHYPLIFSRP